MTTLDPRALEVFASGGDWDAQAHVRLLRANGGASAGYTANLIEKLFVALSQPQAVWPVAWQRRQMYSDIPGYVPEWQFVSKEEATGHFERCPGYEYRPLYPHPADERVVEALLEAIEFAEQDINALTPAGEAMISRWRAAITGAE